ncbi:PepSY domain-containing protein [Methylobacterium organophilum]|uniref:PepSY domain-containing protein n=1 Tax=Methylobacterium organophilum TaxID=410 RepID=A0ABQ4T7W4_METOR|nr:PepSY domain-containing protein [Methylobacterium organophilum]GJE26305.1 hypothetical protein LKMONMHP_1156 [Methylobacterium organophilum]
MMKRLTLATAALALSTGLAAAAEQPAGDRPATTGATQTGKDLKEFQAAALAKTSLAQALTTAESQGDKGRAIEADFERADGKNPAHYAIKVVYPDGKLVEYGIDADTGKLYKTENQPIERYFTRLKPADFQKASTSLKDALAIAEKQAGGGKAYEAEVKRDGSAVRYDISVALADTTREIKVGPDGKIVGD